MTIKIGDRLPNVKLFQVGQKALRELTIQELFEGKRIVLLGIPGAFTPICTEKHIPAYIAHADRISSTGIDGIYCVAVNDPFVLAIWSKHMGIPKQITVFSDGNCHFTDTIGMGLNAQRAGMGIRSQRYSMIVENGIVKKLNLDKPGDYALSNPDTIYKQLTDTQSKASA